MRNKILTKNIVVIVLKRSFFSYATMLIYQLYSITSVIIVTMFLSTLIVLYFMRNYMKNTKLKKDPSEVCFIHVINRMKKKKFHQ